VECKLRYVKFRRVSDPGRAFRLAFRVTGISDDWYRSTMGVIVISLGTPCSNGANFRYTWEHFRCTWKHCWCTWEHLEALATSLGAPRSTSNKPGSANAKPGSAKEKPGSPSDQSGSTSNHSRVLWEKQYLL
jgi:hypothetical protein